VHIQKLELNDTQKLLLYCDLMDENITVINKYLELYYASVWCLVYKAQQTVCQLTFTM